MFQRFIIAAALMPGLTGCELLNGKLPRIFNYRADCSDLDGCPKVACEDCQEDCLRPYWRSADDTAINFGCADGEIYRGLGHWCE